MALRKAQVTEETTTAQVAEQQVTEAAVETAAVAQTEVEQSKEATPTVETVVEQEKAPEVEVVAEQKEVAVQPAANTAVVAQGKVNNAMANFSQEMAEEGYEGMNLTGMSFDRVKLHEAKFQLGSEDISLGEIIEVQIMSTRNIYIVRQHDGNGAEIFYSYDPAGKTKTDGSSAQDILDEWKEDGYGTEDAPLQIKRYIEAMAMLVNRTDEHDGLIVSLSIPPASTDRLAGAFAVGRQMFKAAPSNLVIQCKVGNKIGTGEEAFRPWIFKALRAAA